MDRIEMLHLRSNSQPDRDEAVVAFYQLNWPEGERGLGEILLLRDTALENDLSLCIHWQGGTGAKGKSPLGLRLAAAFSEFGQIYHTVWEQAGKIIVKARKNIHGR